jgi:hypothetical protein
MQLRSYTEGEAKRNYKACAEGRELSRLAAALVRKLDQRAKQNNEQREREGK